MSESDAAMAIIEDIQSTPRTPIKSQPRSDHHSSASYFARTFDAAAAKVHTEIAAECMQIPKCCSHGRGLNVHEHTRYIPIQKTSLRNNRLNKI